MLHNILNNRTAIKRFELNGMSLKKKKKEKTMLENLAHSLNP